MPSACVSKNNVLGEQYNGHFIYSYMKIHLYMCIAHIAILVVKEEKKENPDPIHHTKTIQTQND